MTTAAMTEEQMVHLVRNALAVAGQEMGAEGDHWPAIKSTIHSIMKDWEDLKIERNVNAELEKHYGAILDQMEKDLELCPLKLRPEAQRIVKEMREMYDACFAPADVTMFVTCDAEIPIHIQRAQTIIKTLEDEHV